MSARILGFGFAPFTGGTLSYIDGMGAKALRGAVRHAGGQPRRPLRPRQLLREMAEKGESFYGRGAAAKAA